MAKKKKTLLLTVRIKHKKVPDFGMGKGVIAEREIEFTDKGNRGFESPLLGAAMLDYEAKVTEELLAFEWSEPGKGK